MVSGGYVIPLSQTPTNDSDAISKVTFDVNNQSDNYDNISDQYAAVDDILISFAPHFNNTTNLAYVLSDGTSDMTTITIERTGDDDSVGWPTLKQRDFKLDLPDEVYFIQGNTAISDDSEYIVNNDVLRFTSSNTLSDIDTITGVYSFADLQASEPILLSANSLEIPNTETPDSIRVGQPSVKFDDTDEYLHEIFVLSDGEGLLSQIIYTEDSTAGSAVDYIDLMIPSDKNFIFDQDRLSQIEINGSAFVNPAEYQDDQHIRFPLLAPLNQGDVITFDNVPIEFTEEVFNTQLEVVVNGYQSEDTKLSESDHIRIGNP